MSHSVFLLAKTFSHRYAKFLLKEIGKMSRSAAQYVEEIEENRWRSTAWQADLGLPPRYGILTTNMSESANNMFEKAREGSWLSTIDSILVTMMERICTHREKMNGKDGYVGYVGSQLKKDWNACAGFKVWNGPVGGQEFRITRIATSATESAKNFTINIAKRTCECGKWQDNGYPCMDALAYFRLQKKETLNNVMSDYVDPVYLYKTVFDMMEFNIHPVCIETIAPDGETLPPDPGVTRQSGRPKKKRIRTRPRSACDPDESCVVCSRCRKPGHNIRTCVAREDMERERNERGSQNMNNNNLDLS